jgi:tRNA dimethylallyltransferase
LFVGGTPLYLKSLLRGVVEGPPADPEFRREVEQEVAQVGIEALRQRLHQVDPLAAAKLHPHDQRRMIRALEVYRATGQPISHYQMQFDQGHPAEECRVFVLSWPREVLHRRINDRVDTMFREGIMNEVRRLLEVYQTLSETAMHAVGYREVLAHFAQRCDREAAIEQTKARTRRFARRQETWFRGLSECRWILRDGSRDPRQLAGLIATQAS